MSGAAAEMVPKYSVPTLYRRMLKCYIKKFDTDIPMIIRYAKQTRQEFVAQRNLKGEDALVARIRGEEVIKMIQAIIVPVYENPETGTQYCKFDKESLAAAGNCLDPVSPEEFLRRYHDRLPADEVEFLKRRLKSAGRWEGPDEIKPEEALKIKVKKMRRKCTDPEWDASKAVEEAKSDDSVVDTMYGDLQDRGNSHANKEEGWWNDSKEKADFDAKQAKAAAEEKLTAASIPGETLASAPRTEYKEVR